MSLFDGIDGELRNLPEGFRFSVGHVPHWYRRDDLPKNLRKKPFEAYVINDNRLMGTKGYIFESADAATPAQALRLAIELAKARIAALAPVPPHR